MHKLKSSKKKDSRHYDSIVDGSSRPPNACADGQSLCCLEVQRQFQALPRNKEAFF